MLAGGAPTPSVAWEEPARLRRVSGRTYRSVFTHLSLVVSANETYDVRPGTRMPRKLLLRFQHFRRPWRSHVISRRVRRAWLWEADDFAGRVAPTHSCGRDISCAHAQQITLIASSGSSID